MIDGYSGFTPIGHGGFSTVYLAHQEIFDRHVAVKILHADLADADAQRRFVRECRATGRLTGHPHVVTVFDAGATRDRRPYLAMEYFPGGSLAGRVKTSGPIDVPTVVTTGVAVADALDAAHRADILHRDLKPANVLLRAPTHPVLSDFGIASLDLNADGDAATVSAAFTPGYAAPEILLGEEPTQASDVFALGATLFSLLRGAPPHPGRAPVQVLNRILEHGPEPLGRDDVPPELSALLTQMLDRDPARRPGSAAEVVHRLTALAPVAGPGSPSAASHH
nr:serine/threonine-protein kinase [Micromonospora sp. DSM 115978]